MRYNIQQHEINFPHKRLSNKTTITAGEFFAGGGGWTEGCEQVEGVDTVWILNHDSVALKTNSFHHPKVKVYWADIYVQDEHELEPVDYIHASIECTQHSTANGGKEKKIGSYTMGWELYRYIKHLMPLVLSIENVPEFKKWAPVDEDGNPIESQKGEEFDRWKQSIIDLGYQYKESIRVAADDGLPTTRKRYFAFFFRPGISIGFPEPTHSEGGKDGLKHWPACRPHINLQNEGVSIFGREFNESLPKHLRRPLSPNSLKRIAAGVKKFAPDVLNFVTHYYGGDNFNRFQSIDQPIATITTANRHQLIHVEKLKFIMDYCHSDSFQLLDSPLKPQLTWQTKWKVEVNQLIDFNNFLVQYYGSINTQSIDKPLKTVTTKDRHQLIRIEKLQYITKYFNSNGNPGRNIESIDEPISSIMTKSKHQLITVLDDFDIKARFLSASELASCSTFPADYFNRPGLKLSQKSAVKLIGNAVPPLWATKLMQHNVNAIQQYKETSIQQTA